MAASSDMPWTIRTLVLLVAFGAVLSVGPCLWGGPWYPGLHASRETVAKSQIQNFIQALEMYRLDRDSLPGRLVDLTTEADGKPRGPYIEKIPLDPWGSPYVYQVDDEQGFTIHSLGPDRTGGTQDDVWPWR